MKSKNSFIVLLSLLFVGLTLFGCAEQSQPINETTPEKVIPLTTVGPDLAVVEIFVDDENFVNVRLANLGDEDYGTLAGNEFLEAGLPDEMNTFSLFYLRELPDKNFLRAGGSTVLKTSLQIFDTSTFTFGFRQGRPAHDTTNLTKDVYSPNDKLSKTVEPKGKDFRDVPEYTRFVNFILGGRDFDIEDFEVGMLNDIAFDREFINGNVRVQYIDRFTKYSTQRHVDTLDGDFSVEGSMTIEGLDVPFYFEAAYDGSARGDYIGLFTNRLKYPSSEKDAIVTLLSNHVRCGNETLVDREYAQNNLKLVLKGRSFDRIDNVFFQESVPKGLPQNNLVKFK